MSLQNIGKVSYFELNNQINRPVNGQIPLHKDKEALEAFFAENVEPNTMKFDSYADKLDYLIKNDYVEKELVEKYGYEFVEELYNIIKAERYRFKSFMSAYKFYQQYALKTDDGKYYLENIQERALYNALFLANGDKELAKDIAIEIINQRFQPATPTFMNSGRSRRGEFTSCFPKGTQITLAQNELKNIEDLKIGDEVLTHAGQLKKITDVIVTKNNKHPMLTIKPANSRPVTLTDNHPVLVYSEDPDPTVKSVFTNGLPNENYKWVQAKDIRVRKDYVIIPYEKVTAFKNDIDRNGLGLQALVLDKTSAEDTDVVYNLEVEDDHSYVAEGIAVHNCFLISIGDAMNDIGRSMNSGLQLSKIGGGVGFSLSDLREAGAPIKGVENAASGVVPVMKMFEDAFSYANQLG